LGASAVLTAAGTGIAIIPLLILLGCRLLRGAQAMARGHTTNTSVGFVGRALQNVPA
jgi:hypothetical protein